MAVIYTSSLIIHAEKRAPDTPLGPKWHYGYPMFPQAQEYIIPRDLCTSVAAQVDEMPVVEN